MRRSLSFLTASALIMAGLVACSDDVSSGAGPSDEPAETPTTEPSEGEAESTTADAGKRAKSDDEPTNGFPIDTTPLACVPPGLPTTACAKGIATTFGAAQTLPMLKFAMSIELKIDAGGFFHGVWREQSLTQGITYITNRTGNFGIETVAGALPGEELHFARIAVDACGRPTVLYTKRKGTATSTTHIFVATRVKGGWIREEVMVPTSASDATPSSTFDTADLTFDGNDKPIIVTRRSPNAAPVVSTKGAKGWTHDFLSIQMDGINLPRVVWSSTLGVVLGYETANTNKPTVAFKSGATWKSVELTAGKGVETRGSNDDAYLGLNAGSDGTIHLVFTSTATGPRIMYYTHIASLAGGWSAPVQVPLPQTGSAGPLRVLTQGAGAPRIVFEQGYPAHTYVSTMSDAAFSPAVEVGPYWGSGVAIDANGRLHMIGTTYTDVSTNTRATRHLTQACSP